MSDYNTTADDLHRIHCYADTLAKLCAGSNSVVISPEQLEQIFIDIATVTDQGSAALYTSIDNIKALKNYAQKVCKDDSSPLKPPYIKSHNILGVTHRIYVPEYVDVKGKDTVEILEQGVIIPERYENYSISDFSFSQHAKDSFKEVYFLTPLLEPKLFNEDDHSFKKRVSIRIIRECLQA